MLWGRHRRSARSEARLGDYLRDNADKSWAKRRAPPDRNVDDDNIKI